MWWRSWRQNAKTIMRILYVSRYIQNCGGTKRHSLGLGCTEEILGQHQSQSTSRTRRSGLLTVTERPPGVYLWLISSSSASFVFVAFLAYFVSVKVWFCVVILIFEVLVLFSVSKSVLIKFLTLSPSTPLQNIYLKLQCILQMLMFIIHITEKNFHDKIFKFFEVIHNF